MNIYGYLRALAVRKAKSAGNYARTFIKWLVISCITGAIGGVVGSLFNLSTEYATKFRAENGWAIFFLPLAGILIAALYSWTHMLGKDTNDVIDSVHLGHNVPILLFPVIFLSTVLTHLCGGSAGREGAALQIGGSIGSEMGKLFRLDEKDLRLVTLCGMSGVFAALFGTPLTATFFALEVISVGVLYYAGFVPCVASSLTAYGVSLMFGIAPTRFAIGEFYSLSALGLLRIAVLSVGCALVSIAYCVAMHKTQRLARKKLPNPFLRIVVGGVLLLALTLVLRTGEYNGLGMDVITKAVSGSAAPQDFIWKIVFTVITLGFGYKGGAIVPTFFIGATFGCVFGALLGVPAGFGAAIGLIALFCGAVNCPIASLVLSIELFGASELSYFAVACAVSYMLSGYYGLYSSQKIMYSKLKAEFININAK
jgi:H+/Cl- antiporter ClcA